MHVQRVSALAMAIFCLAAQAESPSHKKKNIELNRAMSLTYGAPSWNEDPTKIDTAYLLVRDKNSGKIVQIQLEETEPDSAQFSGNFNLSLSESEKVVPEVFIPPQDMRYSDKNNKKLIDMVKNGKLPRKPLIWKTNEKGQAVLDVYDTREQASAALKAYQEEQRMAREMKNKKVSKPRHSQTALAAAQERNAMLDKLALDAAKRESERVRLEQIERQQMEERIRKFQALPEKERNQKSARAKALVEEAMAAYEKGNFASAEGKFKQANDLDPTNQDAYFRYGITLYRNNKFNEALVVLKAVNVDPKSENERKYFMGLTHYRLAELDSAISQFEDVAKSDDPVMAPSAEFYVGVVKYSLEDYEGSKKHFEKVIDTSQDPKLDQQAEDYLDRIASAMVYKKMRENKWTLMGIVGVMYDSNVLLSPDSSTDQGSTTDIADTRFLTVADIDYRPILNEHHEWSAHANASLTNSVQDEAATADPFLYNLSLPYSYKGMLFKKGYKLTVKPAYELLYMDTDGTGTKKDILNSYLVSFDNTFVMSKEWFSIYTFEYRQDDSRDTGSEGPDDADATKLSLRTTQMVFLDAKERKEALMANLGFVLNQAKGDNKKYRRIEYGATYIRPIRKWNASWTLGLSSYMLKYPDADDVRDDVNTTLTLGITKPVREWVTWSLMGTYTKNDSNITDTYEYNKYMVLTTATFVTNF